MTTGRRVAIVVAAAAIAIVAFIVLKGGNDDSSNNTASTTTAAKQAPGKPTTPVIHVVDAQPQGGVQTIKVKKGDRVRFTVVSDTTDEIHVHGYDFHKDVKKGGQVTFDFPAKIDGEFVVELESHGEQIASLQVEP